MSAEKKMVDALSDLVFQVHDKKLKIESWDGGYSYLSIEYEGPHINEDTGKADKNCIMYLVSVDAHLSERLASKVKDQFPQDYESLYGWVFIREGIVDIVGMDNFSDEERKNVVKNLNAFFKHLGKK
jgi:hypothetical protein